MQTLLVDKSLTLVIYGTFSNERQRAKRRRESLAARSQNSCCLRLALEIRSHVIQLGGIPEKPLELSWDEIAAIPDDAPLRCADCAVAGTDGPVDRYKARGWRHRRRYF